MTGTYVQKSMRKEKYGSKRAKKFRDQEKEQEKETLLCNFCGGEIETSTIDVNYSGKNPLVSMGNADCIMVFRNGQPSTVKYLCPGCLERVTKVLEELQELGGFDRAKKELCKKYHKKWYEFWRES